MWALLLVEFGRMEVREYPDPEPGPGEVLVEVAFTGICGTDIHGFTGQNGRRVPGQVMGHETSGRVAALGDGLTGPAVGTPVTVNPVVVPAGDADQWRGREQQHPGKWVLGVRPDVVAAFAQRVVVPARNVVPLPDGMPLAHGALIEPMAVATHAVGRLALPDGPVLVAGGGPIGQSVVVALQQAGATSVLVSEPAATRREALERLGAIAIDPGAGSVAEQVRDLAGVPAVAAFDAVGNSASLAGCLTATRPGASVCLVGMATPTLDLPSFEISAQERSLVGSFAYSSVDFGLATQRLAATPASADALVSRTVPLAEAPDTFRSLAAGNDTPGKVLVAL
ncbi:MAG: alcohol dehydrogenase catalytic domain-containing protein [Propionicimonas sp.]|uniref:zinc-dependent alcohol dehydrogenase n=1 Tax=Propionicimonas sp. TaxID=1955623 RepID=UPI003D13D7DE